MTQATKRIRTRSRRIRCVSFIVLLGIMAAFIQGAVSALVCYPTAAPIRNPIRNSRGNVIAYHVHGIWQDFWLADVSPNDSFFEQNYSRDYVDSLPTEQVPTLLSSLTDAGGGSAHAAVFGWPMRSMYMLHWRNGKTGHVERSGAICYRKPYRSRFGLEGCVPCGVIFDGFVANTIVYAAVAGVLLMVLSRLRRHPEGNCPSCGYELGSWQLVCPECGKVREQLS